MVRERIGTLRAVWIGLALVSVGFMGYLWIEGSRAHFLVATAAVFITFLFLARDKAKNARPDSTPTNHTL